MNQEKSCGAIVFTRRDEQPLYVLVREASGAYSKRFHHEQHIRKE